MGAGFVALFIVVIVICIVIGMLIEKRRLKRQNTQAIQGDLNVYCDPEYGPQLLLQLDTPVENIIGQKQATFNVNVIQRISQK